MRRIRENTLNKIPHDWQPSTSLLDKRVILITGAADGIGNALSKACAACGATVVLLDRQVKGLEKLYDKIVSANAPEPAIYPLDLKGASADDYQTLADTLLKEFGQLHGLVHNAATLDALIPLENFDNELWFETLQVNLNAPYLLTKACLPVMKKAADASIIFSSDTVGRHGKAYWGAYGVSKAGLENLMTTFSQELEENTNIRVNSIDPGPVRTALRVIAYPAEDHSRLNTPADVVNPFLYILGPDSKGITGKQFTLD